MIYGCDYGHNHKTAAAKQRCEERNGSRRPAPEPIRDPVIEHEIMRVQEAIRLTPSDNRRRLQRLGRELRNLYRMRPQ